jgi:hypothetical protein
MHLCLLCARRWLAPFIPPLSDDALVEHGFPFEPPHALALALASSLAASEHQPQQPQQHISQQQSHQQQQQIRRHSPTPAAASCEPLTCARQWLELDLGAPPRRIAALRIHNYNKNADDAGRGARLVDVFVDGVRATARDGHVLRAAPGHAAFDFGQTVPLCDAERVEAQLENNSAIVTAETVSLVPSLAGTLPQQQQYQHQRSAVHPLFGADAAVLSDAQRRRFHETMRAWAVAQRKVAPRYRNGISFNATLHPIASFTVDSPVQLFVSIVY